jgi:hypothetical protein
VKPTASQHSKTNNSKSTGSFPWSAQWLAWTASQESRPTEWLDNRFLQALFRGKMVVFTVLEGGPPWSDWHVCPSRWPTGCKCCGPATPKNPGALQDFQGTCHERLQRVIPPDNTRPVCVFSQDESRFGLLTVRRRRLTARGVQPMGLVQHTFAWFYVYGA